MSLITVNDLDTFYTVAVYHSECSFNYVGGEFVVTNCVLRKHYLTLDTNNEPQLNWDINSVCRCRAVGKEWGRSSYRGVK